MTRLYDGAKALRTEGGGAALVIVNPAAGRGQAGRLWRRLEPMLRADFPALMICLTRGAGEAESRAREWGTQNPGSTLLVAGGDGTVHEAVNGLWSAGCRVTLGLLPLGSGNDFARNAGIPLDPVQALDCIHRAAPGGIDLGILVYGAGAELRQRIFLNSLSLGTSARANRLARRLPQLGSGQLRYLCAGLAAVLSLRTAHYRICNEGTALFEGPALNLTVANGPSFGGGIRISPCSNPQDGTLELVRLAPMGRLRALRAFLLLQRGAHLRLPEVTVTSIRALQLSGAGNSLLLEADGEELEISGELRVEIAPRRLTLLGQGRAARS